MLLYVDLSIVNGRTKYFETNSLTAEPPCIFVKTGLGLHLIALLFCSLDDNILKLKE